MTEKNILHLNEFEKTNMNWSRQKYPTGMLKPTASNNMPVSYRQKPMIKTVIPK